jgi:hypothetical protein
MPGTGRRRLASALQSLESLYPIYHNSLVTPLKIDKTTILAKALCPRLPQVDSVCIVLQNLHDRGFVASGAKLIVSRSVSDRCEDWYVDDLPSNLGVVEFAHVLIRR